MPSIFWSKFKVLMVCILSFLVTASVGCDSSSSDSSNDELIARMKNATDRVIETTHVPGVVALVADHSRGIDWLYAAGLSDIPNKIPANESFTFRIGSNTKTFTVTVLLQLVAEGRLSLDDKLSRFLPGFPKADQITIAMLCNMTSGIFNYTEDIQFIQMATEDPERFWPPQELVDVAARNNSYFEPGTSWKYSNSNTIIVGMIVEKITGNSLESEIADRITGPLGLMNTGLLTSGVGLPGIHGRGYYAQEYEEGDDLTEYLDASTTWAAGSAYSAPRELQRYVEALVGGGLLSDEMQQIRFHEYMVQLTEKAAYGLGILKQGTFFGHNGSIPGFTSIMCHSVEKNCTVIIYFNCQLEEYSPDTLFLEFMNILYGNDY